MIFFYSCLVSGISAQVIKYGIQTVKTRKLKLTPVHLLKKIFLETGGMPSSHSSTVTALSTSIAITEGIGTNFIIALAFALITIRDSFGVRYMSGVQAEYLNALSEKLKKNKNWHNRNKSSQGTQKERGSNGHNNRNSLCIYCVLFIVQGKNKWCAF